MTALMKFNHVRVSHITSHHPKRQRFHRPLLGRRASSPTPKRQDQHGVFRQWQRSHRYRSWTWFHSRRLGCADRAGTGKAINGDIVPFFQIFVKLKTPAHHPSFFCRLVFSTPRSRHCTRVFTFTKTPSGSSSTAASQSASSTPLSTPADTVSNTMPLTTIPLGFPLLTEHPSVPA